MKLADIFQSSGGGEKRSSRSERPLRSSSQRYEVGGASLIKRIKQELPDEDEIFVVDDNGEETTMPAPSSADNSTSTRSSASASRLKSTEGE